MSNNSHVRLKSAFAATMSAVVLSCVTASPQTDHHLNHHQPTVNYPPYVGDTFTPSTAMEVSVSGFTHAATATFEDLVDDAYRSLAANQHRLDPRMALVVADSAWDLYVTD